MKTFGKIFFGKLKKEDAMQCGRHRCEWEDKELFQEANYCFRQSCKYKLWIKVSFINESSYLQQADRNVKSRNTQEGCHKILSCSKATINPIKNYCYS